MYTISFYAMLGAGIKLPDIGGVAFGMLQFSVHDKNGGIKEYELEFTSTRVIGGGCFWTYDYPVDKNYENEFHNPIGKKIEINFEEGGHFGTFTLPTTIKFHPANKSPLEVMKSQPLNAMGMLSGSLSYIGTVKALSGKGKTARSEMMKTLKHQGTLVA